VGISYKKFCLFLICLALLSCKENKASVSYKPASLDETIDKSCSLIADELTKNAHIIVRPNDIKAPNVAVQKHIHWNLEACLMRKKKQQNRLKDITVYSEDPVRPEEIKGKGDVFIITSYMGKIAQTPNYEYKFELKKNNPKATDETILKEKFMVIEDESLRGLLGKKENAEETPLSEDEEEGEEEASGSGSLKIINQSIQDNIVEWIVRKDGAEIERGKEIRYGGGSETISLPSGSYRLSVKDNFREKYCYNVEFEIKEDKTTEKIFRGCK
jgi:hypothetical protein